MRRDATETGVINAGCQHHHQEKEIARWRRWKERFYPGVSSLMNFDWEWKGRGVHTVKRRTRVLMEQNSKCTMIWLRSMRSNSIGKQVM
jgi:hypothetical protein